MRNLAEDRKKSVRCDIAANPDTPAFILVLLAKDKHEDVRGCVARNPNTSRVTLAELAKDEFYEVRQAVRSIDESLVAKEAEIGKKASAKGPTAAAISAALSCLQGAIDCGTGLEVLAGSADLFKKCAELADKANADVQKNRSKRKI